MATPVLSLLCVLVVQQAHFHVVGNALPLDELIEKSPERRAYGVAIVGADGLEAEREHLGDVLIDRLSARNDVGDTALWMNPETLGSLSDDAIATTMAREDRVERVVVARLYPGPQTPALSLTLLDEKGQVLATKTSSSVVVPRGSKEAGQEAVLTDGSLPWMEGTNRAAVIPSAVQVPGSILGSWQERYAIGVAGPPGSEFSSAIRDLRLALVRSVAWDRPGTFIDLNYDDDVPVPEQLVAAGKKLRAWTIVATILPPDAKGAVKVRLQAYNRGFHVVTMEKDGWILYGDPRTREFRAQRAHCEFLRRAWHPESSNDAASGVVDDRLRHVPESALFKEAPAFALDEKQRAAQTFKRRLGVLALLAVPPAVGLGVAVLGGAAALAFNILFLDAEALARFVVLPGAAATVFALGGLVGGAFAALVVAGALWWVFAAQDALESTAVHRHGMLAHNRRIAARLGLREETLPKSLFKPAE